MPFQHFDLQFLTKISLNLFCILARIIPFAFHWIFRLLLLSYIRFSLILFCILFHKKGWRFADTVCYLLEHSWVHILMRSCSQSLPTSSIIPKPCPLFCLYIVIYFRTFLYYWCENCEPTILFAEHLLMFSCRIESSKYKLGQALSNLKSKAWMLANYAV